MTLKEAKIEADRVGGMVIAANSLGYYYVINIRDFVGSMGYSPYVSEAAIKQGIEDWKQKKEEFKLKCEKLIDEIFKKNHLT